MKNNNKITIFYSILVFVLGLMLLIKPDEVIKFISYLVGGILIAVGIYRAMNYYIQDKRLNVVNNNELAFGITAVVLGVVFIFLASAIELLLRFIVGIWVIIAGFSKIGETFYTTDRGSKFYTLIILGIVLIGLGLYTVLVSNIELSLIGLFMMIYAIIDVISLVFNKREDVTYNNKTLVEEVNVASDVIEGSVEEKDAETPKKKRKTKKVTK